MILPSTFRSPVFWGKESFSISFMQDIPLILRVIVLSTPSISSKMCCDSMASTGAFKKGAIQRNRVVLFVLYPFSNYSFYIIYNIKSIYIYIKLYLSSDHTKTLVFQRIPRAFPRPLSSVLMMKLEMLIIYILLHRVTSPLSPLLHFSTNNSQKAMKKIQCTKQNNMLQANLGVIHRTQGMKKQASVHEV